MRSSGPLPAANRPEDEVILCCARKRLDARGAERLRALLGKELNWVYLVATAIRHGLAALLYCHLNAIGPESIPEEWIAFLKDFFHKNAARSLYLTGELLKVFEPLTASEILAIPYKGPVLAARAYGNLALRQFVDLDIAVRQRDVPKAYKLLVAEGYHAELDWTSAHQASAAHIPGQYFFSCDGGKGIIELHTELTLRYFPVPLDLEQLAQRLESVSVGGGKVRTFSVEDSLSILCVHASKHFWDRLMWVCDISELVQNSPGVNWKQAEEQARRLGCERMLFLGLYLAHDILESPLPEHILRRVEASSVVRSLAAQVRRRLFQEARAVPGIIQRSFFRLRMRKSVWEGLQYCSRLALAPTEEDWKVVRLPAPLAPLYSALRPLRLIRKYGLGLVRRPEPDLAPFVPTPTEVLERLLAFSELEPDDVLYDLGCGDGRIVVTAAKRFGVRGVGVDIDPRRIREARARARAEGVEHLVRFVRQDAKTVDVSHATVVILFLTNVGMVNLRQGLVRQLPAGARIVSRDFDLGDWRPEKTESIEFPNSIQTSFYLWRIGSLRRDSLADRQLASPDASSAVAAGQ